MKDRIREERERLGFTQTQFAGIGGVTLRSQQNYESTDRKPDAGYLAELAKVGADISYIVTGQRSQSNVSQAESLLLSRFHSANPMVQTFILQGLGLNDLQSQDSGSFNNTFHGKVGQQINNQGTITLGDIVMD